MLFEKERKLIMKKNSKTTATTAEDVGMGSKKTLLVIVTVVGCVGILFPKIFYPMIMNSPPPIKERPSDLLRQERPVHANPNEMYAALKERGRSIPPHPLTVPIIERPRGGLPPSVNIERRVSEILEYYYYYYWIVFECLYYSPVHLLLLDCQDPVCVLLLFKPKLKPIRNLPIQHPSLCQFIRLVS